jgi:hypothetical protein
VCAHTALTPKPPAAPTTACSNASTPRKNSPADRCLSRSTEMAVLGAHVWHLPAQKVRQPAAAVSAGSDSLT